MLERGSLTVARLRGIPIRLHWTLPLGALVFSGLRFAPGFWLGFVLLVLVHELGHAALVRWFHLRVVGIDISGFGGLCHWSGVATPLQRGAIAWGGVLAQAALLAVTFGALLLLGRPRTFFVAEIVSVFTFTNLYLIGLNLLPIPPLDGWEAWGFLGRLIRGQRFSKRSADRVPAGHAWKPPPSWSGWGAARKAKPSSRPPPKARSNGNGGSQPTTSQEQLARMLEQVARDAGKAKRRD